MTDDDFQEWKDCRAKYSSFCLSLSHLSCLNVWRCLSIAVATVAACPNVYMKLGGAQQVRNCPFSTCF
jgi:hypothetical protein